MSYPRSLLNPRAVFLKVKVNYSVQERSRSLSHVTTAAFARYPLVSKPGNDNSIILTETMRLSSYKEPPLHTREAVAVSMFTFTFFAPLI
jgi:hypothetical protein